MRKSCVSLCLLTTLQSSVTSSQVLEEIIVTEKHDARTIEVSSALSVSPDPAQLLRDAPGANVATNGPLSGIPQYRGLFGPRIAMSLNGNQLAPAGPNWMDPPISYAVTAQLETLEVYRGIAPVSAAQETLGGVIDARTRRIDFGNDDGFYAEGRVVASAQSVNDGFQLDSDLQAANSRHRVKLGLMAQGGNDSEFPGGSVVPSRYERKRYDLGYGFHNGAHVLQLDIAHNDTGDSGTPALAMDIKYVHGGMLTLTHSYKPYSGPSVIASIYAQDLSHEMTNFHLRPAPTQNLWRETVATSENLGLKLHSALETNSGVWSMGADYFEEHHDSDIENPNDPTFFVNSFNGAKRKVLGAFVEHERSLSHSISTELGLRVNRVASNAGEVEGTPAMAMPPAEALRDTFNNAVRSQRELNTDLFGKLNYVLDERTKLYAGAALKYRAPSYQERYLWLPLEATAGLADGQLYLGNPRLDSERAAQFEFGVDFARPGLQLHPRFFYYRIDDYIQGNPLSEDHPASILVRMLNNRNGLDRADPLQFTNVNAELLGFDMDWFVSLGDRFSFSGLINLVRGKRRDINDDLYRIPPANMTLRLEYTCGAWTTVAESVSYASQDNVSAANREQTTSDYTTVNLRGVWQASNALELTLGIDNLFAREYTPHLGGYNRVENPDIGFLARLPAEDVNVFARIAYQF